MKTFFTKEAIPYLKKPIRRFPYIYRNNPTSHTLISPSLPPPRPQQNIHKFPNFKTLKTLNPTIDLFSRSLHSLQETKPTEDVDEDDDGPMNEFLSRFVWIMRAKVSEAYPNCDKETVDGMLMIIVQKVVLEMEKGDVEKMLDSVSKIESHDLSQDLWRTVWEVCNLVVEEMRKARKRVEIKEFLQSEDVKNMCKFASEVGIRGDMLRELRFKWAHEKMDERDFYRSLERMREEARSEDENAERESTGEVIEVGSDVVNENRAVLIDLPKRRGKIKYKIYGLDLSDQKWAEVADRYYQAESLIDPEKPKEITGKCKLVMERILGLKDRDDPAPVLAEWVELLGPGRVDWLALLNRLKEHNAGLYFKVAELVLSEESFEANIRDYSKLIDGHSKENCIEDAERILKKMTEKGIYPDILTYITLVHMYSKVGNLDRAKEAFENLRSQGFQPDTRAYNSMIMAYVNAGLPKLGESLMREMEARDIKPTKEIYMELMRAFAQRGLVDGAQRIVNTMQFAGYDPDLESCTLLVEAYGQAGDPDHARSNFDYITKTGHKPDDRCTASMISAYEKKNLLDKALRLLLDLEKDGFEPGVATYTVLLDWLGKLQLVDEAEQVLRKISEKGETPFNIHVSLCDMYSRAGVEKKAREALGIIEGKKELLRGDEFERIVSGLLAGGLVKEANRVHELMQEQGYPSSERVKVALMAAQAIPRQRPRAR